jgi:hypothetical protein
MLEGQYLELCNELQQKFDEKEIELERLKEKVDSLKKTFLSIYGFIRIVNSINLDEDEIDSLLDILRTYCSDIYDEII